MPRHSTINKRNVSPFKRYSITATPEAHNEIAELARRLGVSQGSVIDTAFRALTELSDNDVLDRLVDAGHLTELELKAVLDKLADHKEQS